MERTNLEILQDLIEKANSENFLIYDLNTPDQKVVIEYNKEKAYLITIKENKVMRCTCEEKGLCKHMVKVAIKNKLNLNLK